MQKSPSHLPLLFAVGLAWLACDSNQSGPGTPVDDGGINLDGAMVTPPTGPFTLVSGQPALALINGAGFDNAGYLDSPGDGLLFRFPGGIASDGSRLFVTDKHNNRLLIWEKSPTSSEAGSPDTVLGQSDLSRNHSGNGLSDMNWPSAVSAGDGRLVVADSFNNRILVWNSLPTSGAHGTAASCSISAETNDGVDKLGTPWGVWTDGKRLLVSDTFGGSAAVYVWKNFWSTAKADCNKAPDFKLTAKNASTGKSQMLSPRGISSDGTRLFISESNRRDVPNEDSRGYFVWDTFPEADSPHDDFILTTSTGSGAPLPTPFPFASDYYGLTLNRGSKIAVWCGGGPSSTTPPHYYVTLPTGMEDISDGSGLTINDTRLYITPAASNIVAGYELPLHQKFGASSCTAISQSSAGCSKKNGEVVCETATDFAIGRVGTRKEKRIISHPHPQSDGHQLLVFSTYDASLHGYAPVPTSSDPTPAFTCDLLPYKDEIGFYGAKSKLYQGRYTIVGDKGLLHWPTAPTSASDCNTPLTIPKADLSLSANASIFDLDWGGSETSGEGLFVGYKADGGLHVNFYSAKAIESLENGDAISPECTVDGGPITFGSNGSSTLSVNNTHLAINLSGKVNFYEFGNATCPANEAIPYASVQPQKFQLYNSLGMILDQSGKVFFSDTNWYRVLYWADISSLLSGAEPDAVLGNTTAKMATPGVTQTLLTLPAYLAFDSVQLKLFVGEFDWGSRLLVFDGATK